MHKNCHAMMQSVFQYLVYLYISQLCLETKSFIEQFLTIKKGMKSVCCMLMCNFSNFRKHKNKYFFKMCAGNTNVHQQFSFSNQFQKFLLQKLCMFSVSFTSDVLVQISMFEGVQERRSKRMSVHSHL